MGVSSSIFQRRESLASLDPRLEELGASPWSIFLPRHLHPGLDVGCLLRPFQTLQAMGFLQICGGHGFFFNSGSRSWIEGIGCWSLSVASEVFVRICVFLMCFSVSWVEQLCLYPPRACILLLRIWFHMSFCMLSLFRNTV
jgi:hypothetical protein